MRSLPKASPLRFVGIVYCISLYWLHQENIYKFLEFENVFLFLINELIYVSLLRAVLGFCML